MEFTSRLVDDTESMFSSQKSDTGLGSRSGLIQRRNIRDLHSSRPSSFSQLRTQFSSHDSVESPQLGHSSVFDRITTSITMEPPSVTEVESEITSTTPPKQDLKLLTPLELSEIDMSYEIRRPQHQRLQFTRSVSTLEHLPAAERTLHNSLLLRRGRAAQALRIRTLKSYR